MGLNEIVKDVEEGRRFVHRGFPVEEHPPTACLQKVPGCTVPMGGADYVFPIVMCGAMKKLTQGSADLRGQTPRCRPRLPSDGFQQEDAVTVVQDHRSMQGPRQNLTVLLDRLPLSIQGGSSVPLGGNLRETGG
jgi:hypothetical protein